MRDSINVHFLCSNRVEQFFFSISILLPQGSSGFARFVVWISSVWQQSASAWQRYGLLRSEADPTKESQQDLEVQVAYGATKMSTFPRKISMGQSRLDSQFHVYTIAASASNDRINWPSSDVIVAQTFHVYLWKQCGLSSKPALKSSGQLSDLAWFHVACYLP
jgi:hypothetical protein